MQIRKGKLFSIGFDKWINNLPGTFPKIDVGVFLTFPNVDRSLFVDVVELLQAVVDVTDQKKNFVHPPRECGWNDSAT